MLNLASNGWIEKFFRRNNLVLRRRTSHCQKLPGKVEDILSKFYENLAKLRQAHQIVLPLLLNMDETGVFFDLLPDKIVQVMRINNLVMNLHNDRKNVNLGARSQTVYREKYRR